MFYKLSDLEWPDTIDLAEGALVQKGPELQKTKQDGHDNLLLWPACNFKIFKKGLQYFVMF